MKNIGIAILLLSSLFLVWLLYVNKVECKKFEIIIKGLLDEEISEFQFQSEYLFGDKYGFENFLDSLNNCYDILRIINSESNCELSKEGVKYIDHFVMNTLSDRMYTNAQDPYKSISGISRDSLLNSSCFDKTIAFKEVLTPYWYTRRYLFLDFDIWESTVIDLTKKDSTVILIRLLRNNNDLMHTIEFIESDNFQVINPYLGELTVYKKMYLDDQHQRIEFPVYDWAKKDTFIQEVIFNQ